MTEAKRTFPWGRAGAWLIGGGAVLLTAACAAKLPPRHVTEVPIAEFQPGPDPTAPDGGATGAPGTTPATEAAPSEAAPAAAGAAAKGHAPTPLPGNEGASAAPASGGRPRPPPGQRLTARECKALVDKCAVLTGVSQGMNVGQATKSLPKLRAQSDSTCGSLQSSCVEYNSKSQAQCAMPTMNLDAFKACLE
jgi:hypothetical protein